MLNHCYIIDTIARDKWFERTGNLHRHHQQAAGKGDEKTVDIYADVDVFSTKTSGWSRLQISFGGIKRVKNTVHI